MIEKWFAFSLHKADVDADLFQSTAALFPETASADMVSMCCYLNDPRVAIVSDLFRARGIDPIPRGRAGVGKQASLFGYSILREYEAKDLSSFDYLRACGRNERWWSAAWAQPDGPIQLIAKKFRGKIHLRAAGHRLIVVSDHLRMIIESAGMKHCVFRPAVLVNDFLKEEGGPDRFRPIPWEEFGQPPWWHLTSDITLPPLNLEHIRLVDLYGKPFPNGWRRGEGQGCWVVEGWYHDPELHYKQQAIRAIEPFDAACIHEPWGYNDGQIHRGLVVSQRFRQLCEEHKVGPCGSLSGLIHDLKVHDRERTSW